MTLAKPYPENEKRLAALEAIDVLMGLSVLV